MADVAYRRMRYAIPLMMVLLTAAFSACEQQAADPRETTGGGQGREAATSGDAPTTSELANATFTGISDEPVTLVDGEWEGEPFMKGAAARPAVGLVQDFRLAGDLDGDGIEEAVALIWTSSGGSGTFTYLAAVARRGDRVVHLASAELGDRVAVRAAEIAAGQIVIDTVEVGPEDAHCCPGQKMRRKWTLTEDGLAEVSTEDMGRTSLADLAGVEWVLTRFGRDEDAPAEPEITLTFEGDRIGGRSGCNRYDTTVVVGDMPGKFTIAAVAGTMMACPNEIAALERRYLDRLQAVTGYSFLAGDLTLTWDGDESWGTLFFKARKPTG